MTGFGRASGRVGKKTYTVEVKSVNSRYCEVRVRVPRDLSAWEEWITAECRDRFARGRIDIQVSVDGTESGGKYLEVRRDLLKSYLSAMRDIQKEYSLPGTLDIETVAGFSELFEIKEKRPDPEGEYKKFKPILKKAFSSMEAMRKSEGKKLASDMMLRISNIVSVVNSIEKKKRANVAAALKRLSERTSELAAGLKIDKNRLEQEVVILADKSDITEEIVRLRSHLSKFRQLFRSSEPVGRKMDFLLQEINREANTLSVKAQDAFISQQVVEIKSEIERIREQVQNIQ